MKQRRWRSGGPTATTAVAAKSYGGGGDHEGKATRFGDGQFLDLGLTERARIDAHLVNPPAKPLEEELIGAGDEEIVGRRQGRRAARSEERRVGKECGSAWW